MTKRHKAKHEPKTTKPRKSRRPGRGSGVYLASERGYRRQHRDRRGGVAGSRADGEQGMKSEGGRARVIAQPRVGPPAVDATPQIDGRSPPDTPALQGIIFSGTTGRRPALPVHTRCLPVAACPRLTTTPTHSSTTHLSYNYFALSALSLPMSP